MQVQIRPERPQDIDQIHEVHRLAFGQEDEARLVRSIRAGADFDANLSLVASMPESSLILGHILFSPISIVSAAASSPALSLAPMAVRPESQNRGIGSRLVEAGIDACRSQGHGIVVVVGHPRFYPRFGFVQADRYGLYCPFPAPPEAFMALALRPDALTGVSGMVRYPACFFGALPPV